MADGMPLIHVEWMNKWLTELWVLGYRRIELIFPAA